MHHFLFLFLACAVAGDVPRLLSTDIEVVKELSHGFAKSVVGATGQYSVHVQARTAIVTDSSLHATKRINGNLGQENWEFGYARYSRSSAFRPMLVRAAHQWIIPHGQYRRISVSTAPRLPCPGGGEVPATYVVKLVVSAPGYSPDRKEAVIYVKYEDCLSAGEEVCLLRRTSGHWRLVNKYVLWERGE